MGNNQLRICSTTIPSWEKISLYVTVPKFRISQSEAVSNILISSNIKSLTWYGWTIPSWRDGKIMSSIFYFSRVEYSLYYVSHFFFSWYDGLQELYLGAINYHVYIWCDRMKLLFNPLYKLHFGYDFKNCVTNTGYTFKNPKNWRHLRRNTRNENYTVCGWYNCFSKKKKPELMSLLVYTSWKSFEDAQDLKLITRSQK